MSGSVLFPRVFGTSLLLSVALFANVSSADNLVATAQALFEQGRDLLKAGKVTEACPKLAESQRLDPATGTLLALATCHEAEGRLASAWAEFAGVATRAAREGQVERENWARQRVDALKPRLSTLELQVSDELTALAFAEVRRDGVLLGKEAWNVPVPVDGGDFRITATAAARLPWEAIVHVKQESDAVILRVPELHAAPPSVTASTNPDSQSPARALPVNATNAADGAKHSWSSVQRVGAASLGVGIAVWGAAAAFAFTAKAKSGESPNAQTYGNWATGLAIGGSVAVVSGLGMLIFGGNSKAPSAVLARKVSVAAAPQGVQFGFLHHF